jgi:hypothetical protein
MGKAVVLDSDFLLDGSGHVAKPLGGEIGRCYFFRVVVWKPSEAPAG